MYKNSEGYSDTTAGKAMSRVMKEYHQKRRKNRKRRNELKNRRKVYVISPYAGNIKRNTATAVRCCRYVIDFGAMPVASHLLYPHMLDDSNNDEREMGLVFGLALLALCDEAWVFGSAISSGMEAEIAEAKRLNIPIRYIEKAAG